VLFRSEVPTAEGEALAAAQQAADPEIMPYFLLQVRLSFSLDQLPLAISP
jgi:hypothetical protein